MRRIMTLEEMIKTFGSHWRKGPRIHFNGSGMMDYLLGAVLTDDQEKKINEGDLLIEDPKQGCTWTISKDATVVVKKSEKAATRQKQLRESLACLLQRFSYEQILDQLLVQAHKEE